VQKLDAASQLSMIDDLHRDIRSAAAEVKGQHLPGFCLPKKVSISKRQHISSLMAHNQFRSVQNDTVFPKEVLGTTWVRCTQLF